MTKLTITISGISANFSEISYNSYPVSGNQFDYNNQMQSFRQFYNNSPIRYNAPYFYTKANTFRPYMQPQNYPNPRFQPRSFMYRPQRPLLHNHYQSTWGMQNTRPQRTPFRSKTRPRTKLSNPSMRNNFTGRYYTPRGGLTRSSRPPNNRYWTQF